VKQVWQWLAVGIAALLALWFWAALDHFFLPVFPDIEEATCDQE
tara:strand:+ start:294 stop:425 length:132 start_codon:yes stop_codon:yes gene_type:complete